MKMMNLTPQNPDRIISFVLSAQTENGTFIYGEQDVTYLAIKILYYLDYNMSRLQNTAAYYVNKFNSVSLQENTRGILQYLLEVNIYSKALTMLNISYTHLDNYQRIITYLQHSHEKVEVEISKNPPIFYVAEALEFLSREGLLTKNLSTIAYKYVLAQKLPDGGFHIWGMNYGEPQGTYHAVRIMVLTNHLPDNDILDFIHSWESPLGGFALPFHTQSEPYATYMALYVADFLGINLDKNHTKSFLKRAVYNRSPYTPDDPVPLYLVYKTYKLIEVEIDKQDAEYIRDEAERILKLYLENRKDVLLSDPGWVYIVRLGKEIGIIIGEQTSQTLVREILSLKNPDGSFGNYSNRTFLVFHNTVQAVILLHELGYDYKDNTTLNYILGLQHEGGWGAPDLYNTLYAVQALTYMGYCPQDIEGLLEFINALKYQYGGFRLYSGDTSYGGLQETYFALKTLELLGANGT
ncbi:prenyltransferase/squalene oxidase repeat-containing protein [Thermococcus barossii]|nr:prenyltransferase/squalene oxidase repeat-containing protein [Thermococcus barossii]